MKITESTIDQAAEMFREHLIGWVIHFTMTQSDQSPSADVIGKAYAGWPDESREIVRVMHHASGSRYIIFSCCHYTLIYDKNDRATIDKQGNTITVQRTAPNRSRWTETFTRVCPLGDDE